MVSSKWQAVACRLWRVAFGSPQVDVRGVTVLHSTAAVSVDSIEARSLWVGVEKRLGKLGGCTPW